MSDERPTTESELIDFMHAVDVPAPERLRRATETLVAEHAGSPRRAHRGLIGLRVAASGALAVCAAVVVALVLALGGSGSSGLSVGEAAALTLRPAMSPAPPENRVRRAQLAANVEGLAFPYWGEQFGWRSSGSRVDRISGRTVTTVFYGDNRGQRVGYAIVGGSTPRVSGGGTVIWRAGTPYRLQSENGGHAVVWLRAGHLCVVAGRGVSEATLLSLASWDDHGAVA
jgi:hypothetical protein